MENDKYRQIKKFVDSLDPESLNTLNKLIKFKLWRLDVQHTNDTKREIEKSS